MINDKGFTLIELLISVVIFSIIIAIVSGVFISTLKVQQRVLATQQLLDQTGYLMEYMSRSIRMARKDIGPNCLSADKLNYEKIDYGFDNKGIAFKDYYGDCQEFFREWDGVAEVHRLKEGKTDSYLTSPNLDVVSFNIGPDSSWAQPPVDVNDEQPRVTLFLKIKTKGENQPVIKLQTTISQRNLDIQQ